MPSKLTRTQVAERRAKAVQLRLAGASLDEIGAALQYGGKTPESRRAAVSMDLSRAFQAAIKAQNVAVEQLRQVELERLDRLQRGHWANAIGGDTKAAGVVLQVMDRRSKLLGLDAPVQVDATVTETTQADLEVQELIREAQAKAAADAARLGSVTTNEGEQDG